MLSNLWCSTAAASLWQYPPGLMVHDSASNQRILLAENNAVNQRLGVRVLDGEARLYTVVVANNGKEV
jgi:hypothetical protein